MMKDTSLTKEQMACVYAWLAQLFSRERDDESLGLLQSSEMAEWFAVLKGEPLLEAQVLLLEAKIAALKVREDATLELAADFCSLFLMSDKHAALPYASAHLEGGPNYGVIKQLLSDAGMQVSDTFSESADHLAIFIELLSHLHFPWQRQDRVISRWMRCAEKRWQGCYAGYRSSPLNAVGMMTLVFTAR